MAPKKLKTFTIVDGIGTAHPYLLIDDTDTVVRTGSKPRELADWAFDVGADEVRHEERIYT